jgi:hypothetical protein
MTQGGTWATNLLGYIYIYPQLICKSIWEQEIDREATNHEDMKLFCGFIFSHLLLHEIKAQHVIVDGFDDD